VGALPLSRYADYSPDPQRVPITLRAAFGVGTEPERLEEVAR
jgi:hypothetical protein